MPKTKFLDSRNEFQVELGLNAIAAHATLQEAVDYLFSHGITTTEEKLRVWRDKQFSERFLETRQRLTAQIEARAANEFFDGAREADMVANIAVTRTRELISEGKLRDPVLAARVARDLQQVASQKIDKSLVVQGKPTKVVEHRDSDAIWRRLQELNVVVDSDATEEPQQLPAA